MSTNYWFARKKVRWSDLTDGKLERFGVRERVVPRNREPRGNWTDDTHKYLTDGTNFLHVYLDDDGFVEGFCRSGMNDPGMILLAVSQACMASIRSEHGGRQSCVRYVPLTERDLRECEETRARIIALFKAQVGDRDQDFEPILREISKLDKKGLLELATPPMTSLF